MPVGVHVSVQAVAARPQAASSQSRAAPLAGRSRRALDLVGPGLLLACIAVEAAVLRVGIDDLDEGYFVQQAARVYVYGQVPYRDFESLYTPGLTYLHAALFWVHGGVWLLGPRLLALGGRAAVVGLMYLLAQPLVRNPLWAALPGVVLLVAFDDAPARWEPHPGWLSTALALVGVWCLTHRPSARWLLAAGLAAAGAYVFKQNTGLFALGAIILRCGLDWRRALLPIAAFAGCTAIWLAPLVGAVGVGEVRLLGGFVGAANLAGLYAPPEPTMLVPLACLLAGLTLLRRAAAWLLLAGICLFLTQFPRMDTLHLVWSAPVLLVLGAAALERLAPGIRVCAVAAVLLLAMPTIGARIGTLTSARAAFDGLEVPRRTAADLRGAIGDVQQRTTEQGPIFVYPTSPLIYALADRRNPTPFDHLNPGAATPAQIDAIVEDLQRADVRTVVVSDFWEVAWGAPGSNAALEGWLAAHFETVADDGSYRILRRL